MYHEHKCTHYFLLAHAFNFLKNLCLEMEFFVHTETLDLVVCGAAMLCFTVSQNFTFLPTRRILHPHPTFPSFCNGCCHPVGNKVTSYCDFPLGHQASSPGPHGHPQIFFRQVLHISCMLKKSDHLYISIFYTRYIPISGLSRSNSGELDIVSTW